MGEWPQNYPQGSVFPWMYEVPYGLIQGAPVAPPMPSVSREGHGSHCHEGNPNMPDYKGTPRSEDFEDYLQEDSGYQSNHTFGTTTASSGGILQGNSNYQYLLDATIDPTLLQETGSTAISTEAVFSDAPSFGEYHYGSGPMPTESGKRNRSAIGLESPHDPITKSHRLPVPQVGHYVNYVAPPRSALHNQPSSVMTADPVNTALEFIRNWLFKNWKGEHFPTHEEIGSLALLTGSTRTDVEHWLRTDLQSYIFNKPRRAPVGIEVLAQAPRGNHISVGLPPDALPNTESSITLTHEERIRAHLQTIPRKCNAEDGRRGKGGKYPCIWPDCRYSTNDFYSWKRHSRTRLPDALWVCHFPTDRSGPCAYITERKDKFLKHLRKSHQLDDVDKAKGIAESSKVPLGFNPTSLCGFCGSSSRTWAERYKHIQEHFDKGYEKVNWRDPWHEDDAQPNEKNDDMDDSGTDGSDDSDDGGNDDGDDDHGDPTGGAPNHGHHFDNSRSGHNGNGDNPSGSGGWRGSRHSGRQGYSGNTFKGQACNQDAQVAERIHASRSGEEGEFPPWKKAPGVVESLDLVERLKGGLKLAASEAANASSADCTLPDKVGHTHWVRDGFLSSPTSLESLSRLGQGTQAFVDKVRVRATGAVYARKTFISGRSGESAEYSFQREVSILKGLEHPHITKLIAAYSLGPNFSIVIAPAAHSNLKQYLYAPRLFPHHNKHIPRWLCDLASALSYLHENRIRHADIKPQNILLQDMNIFLGDFGTSRRVSEHRSTSRSNTPMTPIYAAPEIADGREHGRNADVFSLGCVFIELMTIHRSRSIVDYHEYLRHCRPSHTESPAYCRNLPAVLRWIEGLQRGACGTTMQLLNICLPAVMRPADTRPTAMLLHSQISDCLYMPKITLEDCPGDTEAQTTSSPIPISEPACPAIGLPTVARIVDSSSICDDAHDSGVVREEELPLRSTVLLTDSPHWYPFPVHMDGRENIDEALFGSFSFQKFISKSRSLLRGGSSYVSTCSISSFANGRDGPKLFGSKTYYSYSNTGVIQNLGNFSGLQSAHVSHEHHSASRLKTSEETSIGSPCIPRPRRYRYGQKTSFAASFAGSYFFSACFTTQSTKVLEEDNLSAGEARSIACRLLSLPGFNNDPALQGNEWMEIFCTKLVLNAIVDECLFVNSYYLLLMQMPFPLDDVKEDDDKIPGPSDFTEFPHDEVMILQVGSGFEAETLAQKDFVSIPPDLKSLTKQIDTKLQHINVDEAVYYMVILHNKNIGEHPNERFIQEAPSTLDRLQSPPQNPCQRWWLSFRATAPTTVTFLSVEASCRKKIKVIVAPRGAGPKSLSYPFYDNRDHTSPPNGKRKSSGSSRAQGNCGQHDYFYGRHTNQRLCPDFSFAEKAKELWAHKKRRLHD